MRFAEFVVFLAPVAAFALWRWAVARGMDGPPPRQLVALLAGLMLLAGWLIYTGETERLPPGRYVPARLENGVIVPGHSAQGGGEPGR